MGHYLEQGTRSDAKCKGFLADDAQQHDDETKISQQCYSWMKALESDKFKKRVLEIMDREVIQKFDKREGTADSFYNTDEEVNNIEVQPSN